MLELVAELDLAEIEDVIHAKDARGERPYSPRMMTALILYAYCVGVFSSRKIERATHEDVAMRVIAGESHPAWTTINDSPKSARAARTLALKAEEKADELSRRDDDDDQDGNGAAQLPMHRVKTTTDGTPQDKAQRNFTDPDSRIMIRNGVFLQGYNAQAVVSEDQIIVAHGISNDPPDASQLVRCSSASRRTAGPRPRS